MMDHLASFMAQRKAFFLNGVLYFTEPTKQSRGRSSYARLNAGQVYLEQWGETKQVDMMRTITYAGDVAIMDDYPMEHKRLSLYARPKLTFPRELIKPGFTSVIINHMYVGDTRDLVHLEPDADLGTPGIYNIQSDNTFDLVTKPEHYQITDKDTLIRAGKNVFFTSTEKAEEYQVL